jgi:hypothetical protein
MCQSILNARPQIDYLILLNYYYDRLYSLIKYLGKIF